jgi:hypothetical protein
MTLHFIRGGWHPDVIASFTSSSGATFTATVAKWTDDPDRLGHIFCQAYTPPHGERKPLRPGGASLLKGDFIYDATAISKAPNDWVIRTGDDNVLLTLSAGGRPVGMAFFEETSVPVDKEWSGILEWKEE